MFLQNRFFRLGLCSCLFAVSFTGFSVAQAETTKDPAVQCSRDKTQIEELSNARKGIFKSLMRITTDPTYIGDYQFSDEDDNEKKVADYSGKTLLINMWGVWCPPCRAEIGDLAELQDKMGGEDFKVLTIHDQASSKDKVEAFLKEHKAENLPRFYDPGMNLYGKLKRQGLARGFPVTLVVDKKGCLVASLNGAAPWASDDAQSFIKAVAGK